VVNNLLAVFGIPSLTTFEEKVMNDERFREKLANNPAMSEYIASNTPPDVAAQVANKPAGSEGGGNKAMDLMGGTIGLALIKRIASTIV
jgi:hypothetical protein